MAAAAQGVAVCLQCTGAICQCLGSVVELVIKVFRVFTKVVTCGQGWYGLFINFLSLFNSEEDPDLKDFPLPVAEDRKITDLPFFLLFIVVLGGMMAAMNRAIAYGRPEIYFQGIDSWGNVCGYQNVPVRGSTFSGMDMRKYNKLFIFDFIRQASVLSSGDVAAMAEISSKTTTCVKSCPEITGTFTCTDYLDTQTQYPDELKDILCDNVEKDDLRLLRQRTVSFSVRNARCVPNVIHTSISVTKQNEMLNLYSNDWVYNVIADCETCAAELTWITLIATTFTLMFIGVVQNSANNICWFSFSSFAVIGVTSTSAMWYMYYDISSRDVPVLYFDDSPEEEIISTNETTTTGPIGMADSLPQSAESTVAVPQAGYSVTFRDASIIVTCTTGFFILVIFFVGKRNMDFAAVLFDTGSKAMRKIRWLYILPLLTICAISFAAGLFLYTVNRLTAVFLVEARIVNDPTYNFPTVVMVKDTMYTSWVLLFEFVAAYWVLTFITSCQSLIACSAISTWYYSNNRRNLYRPMRIGSTRLIRYHLGSAAIGGLLVGFFGWMRAPFSFLQSRLNQALINAIASAEQQNPTAQYSKIIELSEVESAKTFISDDEAINDRSAGSSNNIPPASKGPRDQSKRRSRRESNTKQPTRPKSKSVSSHYSANSNGSTRKFSKQKESFTSIGQGSTNSGTIQQKRVYSSKRAKPYLKTQETKSASNEINPMTILKRLSQMFKPCFWFLNNGLIYISDFNFGLVGLKGNSFLYSGYKLRQTLLEDPKLKGLGAVCSFSLFLGKLSVMMIVLPFGFLFLKDKEGVFIYGYPLAMSAFISYLVAHVFLSLMNAVVGTIFVCLMEDRALNDGTAAKPYYGTPALIQKSRQILEDARLSGKATMRFASESRCRRKSTLEGASSLYSSSQSRNDVVSQQPKSNRRSLEFGEDHSSLFLLMPKQKETKTKNSSTSDTVSYEDEQTVPRRKRDLEYSRRHRRRDEELSDSRRRGRTKRSNRDQEVDRRHGKQDYDTSTTSTSTGLLGNLFDEDNNDAIKKRNDRLGNGHEIDEDEMISDDDDNMDHDAGNDQDRQNKRKKKEKRDKERTEKRKKKDQKKRRDKKENDAGKKEQTGEQKKAKEKKDSDNADKKTRKKEEVGDRKVKKRDSKSTDKEKSSKSDKSDSKRSKKKSQNADKQKPSSRDTSKSKPNSKDEQGGKSNKKEKHDVDQGKPKKNDDNNDKRNKKSHSQTEKNNGNDGTRTKEAEKPKNSNKQKANKTENDAPQKSEKRSKDDKSNQKRDRHENKSAETAKTGRDKHSKKATSSTQLNSEKRKNESNKSKEQHEKHKDSTKSKKSESDGKENSKKASKSHKTSKSAKAKPTDQDKDGTKTGDKPKGPKKLKTPKLKGLKKPKLEKLKGMKPPKLSEIKGLKKPKIGKIEGIKRPKRARLKGGGGKFPLGGVGGVGKIGGLAGSHMGKGGLMKFGKTSKLPKGGGAAGVAIGGAEGVVNIADGLLRITGKKEDFNNEVNKAAFGTKKRAKATTAVQSILGGNKNILKGIQAMRDVDEQFEEAERYEEAMRSREKRKKMSEREEMKALLKKRNALRKRKKEARILQNAR